MVEVARKAAPARRMTLASVGAGKAERPPRVLMYAYDKVGKTTWAAGAPAPVFLGPEDGAGVRLRLDRFPLPETWEDVLEAVETLAAEKHEFKTLVLDTVDWLEPLALERVCRVNGCATPEELGKKTYGKGYDYARDEWRYLLSRLERLRERGMAIVLLAHAEVKQFKNPSGLDYEKYQLKVQVKTAAILREWADAVLFAQIDTYAVTAKGSTRPKAVSDGARTVYCDPAAAWDAGNRLSLPPTLPLDWADFEAARAARQVAPPATLKAEIGELRALATGVDAAALDKALAACGDDSERLARLRDRLRAKVPTTTQQQGEVAK